MQKDLIVRQANKAWVNTANIDQRCFRTGGVTDISTTISPTETGAWVVICYKALSELDLNDPVLDPYESIILAGKTIDFLSRIRALPPLSQKEFSVYRRLSSLRETELIRVLSVLSAHSKEIFSGVRARGGELDLASSVTPVCQSSTEVLDVGASLYELLRPSGEAKAAIAILAETARLPRLKDELIDGLSRSGHSIKNIETALRIIESVRLVSVTRESEKGSPLVLNHNCFAGDPKEIHEVLTNLSPKQRELALKIVQFVNANPGVPLPDELDGPLANLLIRIGILTPSGIRVSGGHQRFEAPTAPHLWGILADVGGDTLSSDIIDDAKVFLTSIRYGQFFSPSYRGRIRDPLLLLERFLERGEVGPATAIGEDYPLPMARGIVSVVESRVHPGRFHMLLRKPEVVRSVYDVLSGGVIVPRELSVAPSDSRVDILEQAGEYLTPEHLRLRRELPQALLEVRDQIAFELRTYRRG